MVDETIINRIILEGADKIKADLAGIGDAGEKAFGRLTAASDALPSVGRNALGQFTKLTPVLSEVEKAFGNFTGGVSASRASLAAFIPPAAAAQTILQRIGSAFSGVTSGFADTASGAAVATEGIASADRSAIGFGHTLSILGRALHLPELSVLGHSVGVVGRAMAVAIPALLIVGLERVAAAGAAAASTFADVAASLHLTTAQFSEVASASSAVGISNEQMAKSLEAVNTQIKDTAANTVKNENEQRNFTESMRASSQAASELAISFRESQRQGVLAFRDLTAAQEKNTAASELSNGMFIVSLRGIQEERDKINGKEVSAQETKFRALRDLQEQENKLLADRDKQLAEEALASQHNAEAFIALQVKQRDEIRKHNEALDEQDRKERELVRTHQLANIEAERNATALERLGIVANDTNGKLKKAPETLLEIANGLQALGPGLARDEAEFALISAGLDRKLLPSLRQGAIAFKELEISSKRISPPFTDTQIDIANKFAIASQQASSAVSALIDEMGIAIAPAFIQIFEKVRDILVEIRPGLVEFGTAIANIIGPALTSLGTAIQAVIIPALSAFFSGLQAIADMINNTFGTNLTGVGIFLGLLTAIAIAFGGMPAAIIAITIAVGAVVEKLKEFGVSSQIVAVILTTFLAGLAIAFGGIPLLIAGVVTAFGLLVVAWNAGGPVVDFIKQKWNDFTTTLLGWIDTIKTAWANLQQFIQDHTPSILGGGNTVQGSEKSLAFAGGGLLRGPGTPTSDSIPLFGSVGEFMVQAAAVRKYGVSFMHAINSMRFDPETLRFALGGLLTFDAPRPAPLHLAAGGAVTGPGNVLNLTIGTDTFLGLQASDNTMTKLTRFAVHQQVRSAGRRPTWDK